MRLMLSGPLTLTIPIPPSPGAVEIAAIVSAVVLCITFLLFSDLAQE